MKPVWIRLTDQQPLPEDMPVWCYKKNSPVDLQYGLPITNFTHWTYAIEDIPEGPKEPNPDVTDQKAFIKWTERQVEGYIPQDVWHAALKWERNPK